MGIEIDLFGLYEEKPNAEEELKLRLIRRGMRLAGVEDGEVNLGRKVEGEQWWDSSASNLRDLGRFARKEELSMPHSSRITASRWEIILPLDFEQPVQLFPGGDSEAVAFGLEPRVPGYDPWNPKVEEVYCLSAVRILSEITQLYATRGLQIFWDPEVDWIVEPEDDPSNGEDDFYFGHIYIFCHTAIKFRRVLHCAW